MKNISVLLLASVFLFSCKKEDTPALLKIPVTNLIFTVDPTFQPGFEYFIPINDVRPNALAQLDARGIDTANIQSIRPSRATLSVAFAESDLDFLDAVSIRLCPLGEDQERCGREAFYRDPVPFDPGFDLDLVPSNAGDLQDFLLLEKINVQVYLERVRRFPDRTFDIVLDMEFEVR